MQRLSGWVSGSNVGSSSGSCSGQTASSLSAGVKHYASVFFLSLVCLLLSVIVQPAAAVDPQHNWKTTSTKHFYIHYVAGHEALALKAANAAERAHRLLHNKLQWQPAGKTHVVLSDEVDIANGRATPLYFNHTVIYVFPPDAAQGLEDFDSWLETLLLHEYVHVLHLDRATGVPGFLQRIFGRQFLLFPNLYQPLWFIEGLATWYETDMQRGIGRGQSALYQMMMQAEVESGLKPLSQINLPIKSWPMGATYYLYGVYFFLFLEDVYGLGGIDELLDRYSDNVIPFRVNTAAKSTTGKDAYELWSEFSHWLAQRFRRQQSNAAESQWQHGEQLSHSGYRTGYPAMTANGDVYYIDSRPDRHSALYRVSENGSKKISDVHPQARVNASLSEGPGTSDAAESSLLITQMEFCDEYNLYNEIFKLDPAQRELKQLSHCGRYQAAIASADGQRILALKVDQGIGQLQILNAQGELQQILYQSRLSEVISQIKWSVDEQTVLAAVFRENRGWNIEEFSIASRQWHAITNDRHIDMYPSYSDGGNSILFSSERSGRYQIYRYTRGSDKLELLSRVKYGAFYPLQLHADSPLYYMGYHAGGYDLYRINQVTVLDELSAQPLSNPLPQSASSEQSSSEVTLSETEIALAQPRDYSAWQSVYPRWWFPMLSMTEDSTEVGLISSGQDALALQRYSLILQYDIDNNWATGNVNYVYANRLALGYRRSYDYYRNASNQLALSRKDDDAYMLLNWHLPKLESNTWLKLGVLNSRSDDVFVASNQQPVGARYDRLVGAAALYSNSKHYLRSISEADGRSLRLIAESSDLLESDYSGEIYTLDWREYISLGSQHVLAVRLLQGWGTDQPELFRLGGEDNDYNILDFITPQSDAVFGKREYALRGYAEGLPELSGRRMQLAGLEWRFPGQLLERGIMSPPLGIIQWSGSVFAETAAAYDGGSPDTYYSGAGVELQADINLFYGITSRMRLGYARGLDETLGDERVYFMLGASF